MEHSIELVTERGRPIDVLLLDVGVVPGKKSVILRRPSQRLSQGPSRPRLATLIGHHQPTVGLLCAANN